MAVPGSRPADAASDPMGNDVRDGPEPLSGFNRACPICGTSFKTIGRGHYCSGACRQQAFRDRRAADELRLEERVTRALRRQRELVAHTVYECPACEARLLGERRCPDCNLMCRRLGLGGPCPHCDELVVVTDFLP